MRSPLFGNRLQLRRSLGKSSPICSQSNCLLSFEVKRRSIIPNFVHFMFIILIEKWFNVHFNVGYLSSKMVVKLITSLQDNKKNSEFGRIEGFPGLIVLVRARSCMTSAILARLVERMFRHRD